MIPFFYFLTKKVYIYIYMLLFITLGAYYDPNAPSGASTAASVFEDWRLLQLSAFCSLQYLDRSLVICFFLRLMFAYFYSYLHVLDVFRYFVSWQVAY